MREIQNPEQTGATGRIQQIMNILTPQQQSLVLQNIGLVRLHLRNRVTTPKIPRRDREYDDLFQEGCLALVRAAVCYDPKHDGGFAAYALPRIRRDIYLAIHDKFSLIHIPFRVLMNSDDSDQTITDPARNPILELQGDIPIKMPLDSDYHQKYETIRYAIRRRFELAVQRALNDLWSRKWRRRNPSVIMERIANERLLISNKGQRISLRRIARETGISSGRASSYERKLIITISQYLQNDIRLPLLIKFANQNPAGFDAPLDERRRELLMRAEMEVFIDRFRQLEKSERAQLLYSLLEQSTDKLEEVALNLYRLAISGENEIIPANN